MLAAITSTSALASENPDTVAVIEQPATIEIIQKGDSKTIIVQGRKGDPDYRLEYESAVDDASVSNIERLLSFKPPFSRPNVRNRKRPNPSVHYLCDFYSGASIPSDADRGLSRAGWEIGMLNVWKMEWRLSRCGTRLSFGLGWQYRHLTIGDGLMADRSDNGSYALTPIPSQYYDVKSSLKNFSIQFPLLLSQNIYRTLTIEFGGVGMLNTYTTGNCSWREDGVKSKRPIKHLHQRILTVDALARIGWRGDFAFYVRYSPMSLFSRQFGPQFESVAIGASLGF